MTSSWFFLSTLNYDARSTTHQIYSVAFVYIASFKIKNVYGGDHEDPVMKVMELQVKVKKVQVKVMKVHFLINSA